MLHSNTKKRHLDVWYVTKRDLLHLLVSTSNLRDDTIS